MFNLFYFDHKAGKEWREGLTAIMTNVKKVGNLITLIH